MRTLAEKTAAFRALHDEPGTFIIPNPWDAGTARLLAGLGFKALATTSLGLANIHGRGFVSADEIIENARMIAAATDLPTNGDLENCGADEPDQAAKLIPRASEAGLAGGSIEDFTGDTANPIYGLNLAVERVYAAVEAAKNLPVPFVLTARAEQLIHGSTDLDATIRRLQAFEQAGADGAVCAGAADARPDPYCRFLGRKAGKRSDDVCRSVTHPGAIGRRGSQADQHRRQRFAVRAQRFHDSRARDGRAWQFHLCRRKPAVERTARGIRQGSRIGPKEASRRIQAKTRGNARSPAEGPLTRSALFVPAGDLAPEQQWSVKCQSGLFQSPPSTRTRLPVFGGAGCDRSWRRFSVFGPSAVAKGGTSRKSRNGMVNEPPRQTGPGAARPS